MKRLFQRMDQGPKEPSTVHTSYVGKVFVVGRHTVTVEDTIAEGGFALVFLVKGSGGVRYALKRLCVNSEHDLIVARNEINILKSLSGARTVVGLIDYQISAMGGAGVHEVLILMTYYKRPLLHLLNERLSVGLTEAEVLKIFCDVCDAVFRLHHARPSIIHRDLKVENILCSSNGFVLCDFGSATSLEACPAAGGGVAAMEEELSRYTTLAYRAPEMVDLYAGNTISTKADIWALGCLLYKLCFFTLPFGESPLAITSGSFNFPSDSPVKYSDALLALIRYLLTPCPESRPDIFQTTSIAARIAGLQITLPNVNNVEVPSIEQLLAMSRESPSVTTEQPRAGALSSSKTTQQQHEPGTSVAPRQRPKPQQLFNAGPPVLPPIPAVLPSIQPPPAQHPTPPVLSGPGRRSGREDSSPEGSKTTSPLQGVEQQVTPHSFPPAELFGSEYTISMEASVSAEVFDAAAATAIGDAPVTSIASPPQEESQPPFDEVSDAFFPASGKPAVQSESEGTLLCATDSIPTADLLGSSFGATFSSCVVSSHVSHVSRSDAPHLVSVATLGGARSNSVASLSCGSRNICSGHVRSSSCVEPTAVSRLRSRSSADPRASGHVRTGSGTKVALASSNVGNIPEGNVSVSGSETVKLPHCAVLKPNNPFLSEMTPEELATLDLSALTVSSEDEQDLLNFCEVPSIVSERNKQASAQIMQMFNTTAAIGGSSCPQDLAQVTPTPVFTPQYRTMIVAGGGAPHCSIRSCSNGGTYSTSSCTTASYTTSSNTVPYDTLTMLRHQQLQQQPHQRAEDWLLSHLPS